MKQILSFLVLAVFLTSCSSSPEERIYSYLQEGEYKEAMLWLNEELEDEPNDALLNFLAAKVLLKQCEQESCFSNNADLLQDLPKYIARIETLSYRDGDEIIDLYNEFSALLEGLSTGSHHPVALVKLAEYLPEHELKTLTFSFMSQKGLVHIEKGEMPASIKLFGALGENLTKEDPSKYLAKLIYAYAANDKDIIQEVISNPVNIDDAFPIQLPVIQAFPYAVYQHMLDTKPNEVTLGFLHGFRNILQKIPLTYLVTPEGKAEMANAVYAMARNDRFMREANSYLPKNTQSITVPAVDVTSVAVLDATTTIKSENLLDTKIPDGNPTQHSDINEELRFRIMKLALLINPSSIKSWKQFLDPTTAYALKTGQHSVLFDQLTPQDVPVEVIDMYNESLFKLVQSNIDNNKSILNLVQHIILPSEGVDVVKNRVAQLLNEAMIRAVDAENYDLVYEYASFQPDVAKLSRQKIVSITIDALEKKWNKSEFEGMNVLSQFLTKTMGIDFSLDSFLLQSFDDHLTKIGVQKELDADVPDNLLMPEENVRVDLGEKFTFLQTQFEKRPSVLDNMLKNLIVKAEGVYGVPNALYRLNGYFSDDFKKEERKTYLEGAIENSLKADKSLGAIQFAEIATKFHEKYNNISMLFVVNESLNRAKDLEDIKELWHSSPELFKEAMKETRPQYVTLMRAIEAYEQGSHQDAASLFTVLSDPELIQIARPYLAEYIETVNKHAGVYTTTEGENDDRMNTQFIRIDLATDGVVNGAENVSKSTEVSAETELLSVSVSFVNALGTIKLDDPKTLSEDYGTVVSFTVKGNINPNNMEINILENEKSGEKLPASFEKMFGDLDVLSLDGDTLNFITKEAAYTFKKVYDDPNIKAFPEGRFIITKELSEINESNDYILPTGSIIELFVDEDREIIKGEGDDKQSYYIVSGNLHHPASSKTQEIKGYYNPKIGVSNLVYKYPYPSGGTLDAYVRCQNVGTYILCAGHNKYWERQKFSYIVSGQQIQPTYTEEFVEEPLERINRPTAGEYQSTGNKNRP